MGPLGYAEDVRNVTMFTVFGGVTEVQQVRRTDSGEMRLSLSWLAADHESLHVKVVRWNFEIFNSEKFHEIVPRTPTAVCG